MNALIDQLAALRLHGMAACAQDLLAARTPPSLTTALKTLIEAETEERRLTALPFKGDKAGGAKVDCIMVRRRASETGNFGRDN